MPGNTSESVGNSQLANDHVKRRKLVSFYGSQVSSDEFSNIDASDNVDDPNYVPKDDSLSTSVKSEESIDDNKDIDFRSVEAGCAVSSSCRPSGSSGGSPNNSMQGKVKKTGRVRVANKKEWAQNVAKERRQKGLDYVSYSTKKPVKGREQGQPCADGCFDKVGLDVCKVIFSECWAIGNYDARLSYLNSCVHEVPFKRKYTKKEVSLRPMQIIFNVKHVEKVTEVCRKGFASIHGLTAKEMRVFLKKRKASLTGPMPQDKRGKHPSARKISGKRLECVHEHIKMLSVTSSHYSRMKNPYRQYADERLSLKKLYQGYMEWIMEKYPDESIVSEAFYKHVFTTCYNIVFQWPKTDLCNDCESIKQSIASLEASNENPDLLEGKKTKLSVHKKIATEAHTLLHSQAFDKDPDTMVIAIELQQTLPCPKLPVNCAYYTRKISVYNFCVYDLKEKVSFFYIWDESTGGRGANEVASCILRWVQEHGGGRQKLRIFADNCGGQNKNRFIVLMALQQVQAKFLQRVEFIYLISGHSYLPCDRAFGVVEKKLRLWSSVHCPSQYVKIIKTAINDKKIRVTVMGIADFVAFNNLENYCKWSTPSFPASQAFQNARQLVVDAQRPAGYSIKLHYNLEDTPTNSIFTDLCLGGRGKGRPPKNISPDFDLSNVQLERCYPGKFLPIGRDKLKDLKELRKFMGAEGQAWVDNLLVSYGSRPGSLVHDPNPDESPSEDNFMDYESVRCVSNPYSHHCTRPTSIGGEHESDKNYSLENE